MSPDNRDESYWLGVRDALRMIDSFLKWSKRNPEKAKDVSDFLNEALIAAAKRCESCLSHALGITFSRTGHPEDDSAELSEHKRIDFFEESSSMIKDSPLTRTLTDPEDLYSERAGSGEDEFAPPDERLPELAEEDLDEDLSVPPEPWSRTTSTVGDVLDELPSDEEERGASIDYLEPSQEPSKDEMEFPDRRSFESDFDLVEPKPFDTDAARTEPESSEEVVDEQQELTAVPDLPVDSEKPIDYEPSEAKLPEALDQLERDFSSHGLTISPTESDMPGEEMPAVELEHTTEVVEPVPEPPPAPEIEDLEIPVAGTDTESHDVAVEEETPPWPEPPPAERKAVWSPYDEPSTLEEASARDESPDDESVTGDKPEDADSEERPPEPEVTAPPPPPPPPESDETEEERRRRARRLFFGA